MSNRKNTIDEKEHLQKGILIEVQGLEDFLKSSDTFLIVRATENLLLQTHAICTSHQVF